MTRPSDIPEDLYQWAADFWDAHLATEDIEMVARAFMAGQGAGNAPPRFGITAQQREVLDWVKAQTGEHHGTPPSIREIAGHFGCSVSAAHASISALVERGFLIRLPGQARSIAVVHVGDVSSAHKNSEMVA